MFKFQVKFVSSNKLEVQVQPASSFATQEEEEEGGREDGGTHVIPGPHGHQAPVHQATLDQTRSGLRRVFA